MRCLRVRPGQVKLWCGAQRNWADHLHDIAEEVCHVAEFCIGQDMGTMSTATAFLEMEGLIPFYWKNPHGRLRRLPRHISV